MSNEIEIEIDQNLDKLPTEPIFKESYQRAIETLKKIKNAEVINQPVNEKPAILNQQD